VAEERRLGVGIYQQTLRDGDTDRAYATALQWNQDAGKAEDAWSSYPRERGPGPAVKVAGV